MLHHTPLIAAIATGFVLAFIFGALANRLRLSPLVGYLLAGVMMVAMGQLPLIRRVMEKLTSAMTTMIRQRVQAIAEA